MQSNSLPLVPRAIVATSNDEVRDFLEVHLRQRGFAVELVHRADYLRVVAPGALVLLADASLLRAAALPPADRPHAVFVLSASPSAEEALQAALCGARRYLPIPFADPASLACMLDAAAAEARATLPARAPELVPAG